MSHKVMETSQLVATESFSYSWLSNAKLSWDGQGEPSTTYLDGFCGPSKSRGFLLEAQNFDFEIPESQSPHALRHADELFSNGLIKPVFVDPSTIHDSSTSGSSFPSGESITGLKVHFDFLRKWRKFSKRMLQKSVGYLRPFCHKIKMSRKCNKVDDFDRRLRDGKSQSESPLASPQNTRYLSYDSYDIESSINEAIQHCKRSIGK